jgi:tetratricopeptide (TPR) repeat protein
MSRSPLYWLAVSFLLIARPGTAPAADARPAPAPRPPSRAEIDRREAERLYARALLLERDSRLIEAIDCLEKATRLDPEAADLRRAVVPLYLAVDRTEDALKACRNALDLEPGDFETWFLYARQLKLLNRTQDAIAALDRAAACPGLKDRPDLRLQIHFDLGVLHENAQEFAKAAAAFREVTALLEKGEVPVGEAGPKEAATQAAETYERLGRVCVRAKRFDEAIAAYRKAQEKDPQRRPRINYNLADVYVGQGKLKEALDCLDDYLRTQPEGTEAYEMKIDLLHRLGRGNDVVRWLEVYAEADAQNPALKLLLARQYALAGRKDSAANLYGKMLETSPTPEVYRGLFTLLREEGLDGGRQALAMLDDSVRLATGEKGKDGDTNEAAKARAMLVVLRDDANLVKAMLPAVRERLQSRSPRNPRAPVLQSETCRVLALLAERAHALDDAERLYRACLDTMPRGPGSNEADIYIGLLDVLRQGRKYEEMVEVCRQGIEHAAATRLLVFHFDMSEALMALGRMDEALAEANRAVDIATEEDHRLQMRCFRARLLAMAGRTDEAETEGKALFKDFKAPSQVKEIRYTLSEIYSQAKKLPQAEEQLQLVLKENPDEARAHNDLGYTWADQGKNLEQAEKLIREALDLDRKQRKSGAQVGADTDQDNGMYVDSLGWVLFKRGRLKEARATMEKACRLPEGADDPVVWDHMGDVYHKLGETEKARTAWQKALEEYRKGGWRRPDDRPRDIEHKLKLLKPAPPGH